MNKIWIKVKYTNYVNIISKLNYININIYEIKRYNKYLLFKIDNIDYDKLIKYIKSYKFIIYKKTGISYIYYILKNNLIYFIMSFLGIILFYIFNNIIIDIKIYHENSQLVSLVSEALRKEGISKLTFKKNYEEIHEIKENIINTYENQIDWLEIEVNGMRYDIRLEEKIINEEEVNEDYCNIYATKDGVIKSISVIKGIPVVKTGDYVKKGDLLISGDIIYNEEIKNQVCAKGTVYAESWYEVNVKVPLIYYSYVNEDNIKYNLLYTKENNSKLLLKNQIDNYEEENTLIFNLFGVKLYLQKQTEVSKVERMYTENEALEEALRLAGEKILMKLDDDEEITLKKVLKKSENNSTIEADIFIVTIEVIS